MRGGTSVPRETTMQKERFCSPGTARFVAAWRPFAYVLATGKYSTMMQILGLQDKNNYGN